MKHRLFTVSALAIGLAAAVALPARPEDARHYDAGAFTLKPGDAAELTEDRIPLAFVQVWAHPFGNRAINIKVAGKSYSVGVGARIDLKSPYSPVKAEKVESALAGKDRCNLEIVDFDNSKDGVPQVTFRLDCA
jgi:hypothetical protein